MTRKEQEEVKKVCRERDTYKAALDLIAKTDRRKVAMMGVLAVADAVNLAKNALRKGGNVETTVAKKVKIVCICGSTRFIEEMAVAAWEMEKQGILVIGPHLLPANYPGVQRDHQAEAEGVREVLDELHLRKIDLCDEIYVVDPGGYIGTSTKNELEYARKQGKPIRYMVPVHLPAEE